MEWVVVGFVRFHVFPHANLQIQKKQRVDQIDWPVTSWNPSCNNNSRSEQVNQVRNLTEQTEAEKKKTING